MHHHLKEKILECTEASEIIQFQRIQSLWSGYGEILRVLLEGGDRPSVVVKIIAAPKQITHPRGWNGDAGHLRKLKSYEVECLWYQQYVPNCTAEAKIPTCLALFRSGSTQFVILEDLKTSGFPVRLSHLKQKEILACVNWLANFHAHYLGIEADGLWETGTYWHLATRQDELQALSDPELRKAAVKIDQKLSDCSFKTIVHGDAKVANFCFSEDGRRAAAVDFQYVGGGCGMKDLAYFLGSCLSDDDLTSFEDLYLDDYFNQLSTALKPSIDQKKIEKEWRTLYPYAVADFQRFLQGWSPGHWKSNSYAHRITQQVLRELEHE